jgi:hypothetical protein
MNKETRTFIWGLILLLLCTTGFSIHLIEMVNGTWKCNAWQMFLFIGTTLGMIIGAIKVSRTTD